VLRLILLTLGLLTLCLIVWHIGPGNIYNAVTRLGPGALLLILLPSILMYALEAYGWRMTLGRYARIVPFWRLLAIRTAGEVVNMTTPTAYVAYRLSMAGDFQPPSAIRIRSFAPRMGSAPVLWTPCLRSIIGQEGVTKPRKFLAEYKREAVE